MASVTNNKFVMDLIQEIKKDHMSYVGQTDMRKITNLWRNIARVVDGGNVAECKNTWQNLCSEYTKIIFSNLSCKERSDTFRYWKEMKFTKVFIESTVSSQSSCLDDSIKKYLNDKEKDLVLFRAIEEQLCLYATDRPESCEVYKAWEKVAYRTQRSVASCRKRWTECISNVIKFRYFCDADCDCYLENVKFAIPFIKKPVVLLHRLATTKKKQNKKEKQKIFFIDTHECGSNTMQYNKIEMESKREFLLSLVEDMTKMGKNQETRFRRNLLSLVDDILKG